MAELPRLEHFNEAHLDASPLVSILRSHQIIDSMITYLVLENMKFGNSNDVMRSPFMLKVDLALNAAQIPGDLRPLLERLNRVRNKLIHDFFAEVTEEDVAGIKNMIGPAMWETHRESYTSSPQLMIRLGYRWAYAMLSIAISEHRDNVVRREASKPIMERVAKIVAEAEAKNLPLPKGLEDPEVSVKADRDNRQKRGDY